MIIIVTGNRGIGKTTFLLREIERMKKMGLSPSGILTPAIYNNKGSKTGFHAMDISSGDKWDLGRSDIKLEGPEYGPFSFSNKGFERANSILKKAFINGSEDVFLDEIGPLEMEKGYGFLPVLSETGRVTDNRNIYLVIRGSLIEKFTTRFLGSNKYRIIEVTMENRDQIRITKQ